MSTRNGKSKQLQLELQYGYLKQLNTTGERLDSYETMAQALLGNYSDLPDRGPLWDEINRPR